MFGFFSKKRKENEFVTLLRFETDVYAKILLEIFENMDPATRAHVLVAYQNLLPFISALHIHATKNGETYTVEQFIVAAADRLESVNDEINTRKWAWLLHAALLGRLEKICRNDPLIRDIGAAIWCLLAEETPRLKILLPNNVVWKDSEKEWFDLSQDDISLIGRIINHTVPPVFSRQDRIKYFAQSKGCFYFPTNTRIGAFP